MVDVSQIIRLINNLFRKPVDEFTENMLWVFMVLDQLNLFIVINIVTFEDSSFKTWDFGRK